MAFDTLQVDDVEGLLSFTDTNGHRSTSASLTWRGQERESGESEMNNLKLHQQPHEGGILFL